MSDREAEFREFVAAQMDQLRGLAYVTCGDWQTAEDAVLTALARVYVKWGRIDNVVGYARSAVVRAAVDETRRPWWRRERSGANLPDRAAPDVTGMVDDRIRLRQALQHLAPRQRAVLVLRYLEGLSVRQTAEALHCPEGTVKVYTARGLETLRRVMGAELEERHA